MPETAEPIINDLNRPFWDAAAEGQLMLPHCADTGVAFWPPAPLSPFLDGGSVVWRPVAAEGYVMARAVYRRAFQQAFAHLLPYGIAMVHLDCGVRLQAHVPAPDMPGSPVTGSRVTIRFDVLLPGGRALPVAHAITD
ncbi:hypothetical protein MB02_07580 [Croceicoccus estronivorus]|uniref:Zn-ribbon domain-containing OB-fold protein n=1 Tax=Croceicoccus estronivorus TaxID=1172626 RepID=UPI00082E20FF|nr:OB-fold domain-containing protein [Croceicoccus estronivorus]OCC24428.1 hypothetical protein MB02_07580 [Croceicoccus estronivorus]